MVGKYRFKCRGSIIEKDYQQVLEADAL